MQCSDVDIKICFQFIQGEPGIPGIGGYGPRGNPVSLKRQIDGDTEIR